MPFKPLLSLLLSVAVFAMVPASAGAEEKMKVVYHLSEAEKAPFVLSNIRNHINGMGGPDKVEIVLVVHGPAGTAFHDLQATEQVRNSVVALKKDGVGLAMCRNTMKAQGVDLGDLVPGFTVAEQGGVVKIAELQRQGYVYIRP